LKTRAILAGACFILGIAEVVHAQTIVPFYPSGAITIPRMVSPDIDPPGEPFSYFSQSTDQIGVMHAPSATEITPEGYLYTGFGELMFYVGLDRTALKQRIRTLEAGHLPILSYEVQHDGLVYRFTMFAASVAASAAAQQNGEEVVDFVRVSVRNPSSAMRRGFVTTAWRYHGDQTTLGDQRTPVTIGDNRFRRPVEGKRVGDYQQPGALFNPDSVFTVHKSGGADSAFLQDGRAIYFFPEFPEAPAPEITPTYRDYYNRESPATGNDHGVRILPTTPMATAEYALEVPAGAERSLDFKIPLLPVEQGSAAFTDAEHAEFDERHAQVRDVWNAIIDRGIGITTPEDKVNQLFQTCLVNDLLALNKVGDDYVQTINQLHYHAFYLRDSADFIRMYDTSSYPDMGRQVINFFATRQQPDGNFLSQPGQYDGWGQALWSYGEHYRMTHDKAFAAEVYPRVVHAVEWFEKATASDPMHLMPATDVRDNEYIAGHLTGYNFLALDGLQAAELLAHDLGHTDDEKRFHLLETTLRANFMKQLDAITAKTGGYIPPALDGNMGGTDWGNLLSLTPEKQLAPEDPRVTATLRATQQKYAEGLITYRQPDQGVYLHHYLTIKNTLTELIRGEQQQAIREFYAETMHTSSTNAGFEYSIRPWGDRDFSGNLAPHGWFAAEYRNLLRNMMVREEGTTLHLLSAVSPDWVGAGKEIKVERAATYFGTIGFDLTMPTETSAVLTLAPQFNAGYGPKKILVHLPWFVEVSSLAVDGRAVTLSGGSIEVATTARRIDLNWKRRPLPGDMPISYADAVDRYKHEYRERYEFLLGAENTLPRSP
jgi:hypothetical protein